MIQILWKACLALIAVFITVLMVDQIGKDRKMGCRTNRKLGELV